MLLASLATGSFDHASKVSYTHDRDFGRYKAWPEGKKERFLGRGWCPPRGKEYVAWHWRIEKRERESERGREGGREGARERGSC